MQTQNSMEIKFIQILEDHIDQVVDLHIESFPRFFLSELGKEVLCVFYRSLLENKSIIFYGVRYESKLVGFFVASTEPNGLYKRLFFKNITRFLFPLFFSLLKNLKLLKRMITSLISLGTRDISPAYRASLLSICVSPVYAGKGVGKKLLNKLEEELVRRRQTGYHLTTDKEKNNATNHFYLTCGFELYGNHSQGKRIMNIYVKDIK